MKRDIIFIKSTGLANILLATGKVKNEGHWVLSCNGEPKDMEIIQKACSDYLKDTSYKNYKLCFANSENYKEMVII